MGLFGFFKSDRSDTAKKAPLVTKGQFFSYTHTPQIMPRLRAIGQKFGHFAFMLAMVYRSARLLPDGHPMLNPANIGRYGIRDVVATAANGLVMKRENLDQILIFGAVLMAFVLIALQTVMILVYTFLGTAMAADPGTFGTENPNTDVMLEFLHNVFGVADIFGSHTYAKAQPGLYAILGFYSTAMMIIAVLIVLYYVVTVVGESAQSGTPFGRRFNGLWAPIRLILALGLLVPLGSGLNAGQYLTLYVAKFGSGLATNGWVRFTNAFDKPEAILANFTAPSILGLGQALFMSETCRATYNVAHNSNWSGSPDHFIETGTDIILPMVIAGTKMQKASFSASDITFARTTGNDVKKLTYVWAAVNTNMPTPMVLDSTCGAFEVTLVTAATAPSGNSSLERAHNAISAQQLKLITLMNTLITGMRPSVRAIANKAVDGATLDASSTSTTSLSTLSSNLASTIDSGQGEVNSAIQAAYTLATLDLDIRDQMKRDAKERGWGTAGIYYLEMSRLTQAVQDGISRMYPQPVMGSDGRSQASVRSQSWFGWLLEKIGLSDTDTSVRNGLSMAESVAKAAVGKLAENPKDAKGIVARNDKFGMRDTSLFSDPVLAVAKWLFGDAMLTLVDEPTLNPMQRMLEAGSYVLDRAHTLVYLYVGSQAGILLSAAMGAVSGAAVSSAVSAGTLAPVGAISGAALAAGASAILSALGGILWFLLTLGLAVGIVLFYLLPLMPFMYFFFSAVNWVVEVAEAFISMPLFALAHLRIDGEGLPGQTAYQGWLTLLGVMLRPMLIVLGLIVGSLIFNAGAYYLNQVYKYAIFAYNPGVKISAGALNFENISGFGIITYVILYVYLVYMLANSSFKLIDQIPDKMMRWIGGSTPFTGDRPVDIGNMQGMALAGFYAMDKGNNAVRGVSDSISNRTQKGNANVQEQLRLNPGSNPGRAGPSVGGGAPGGGTPGGTPGGGTGGTP